MQDKHGTSDLHLATLARRIDAWLGTGELVTFLALHASHHIHLLPLVRLVELVLVVRRDASNRLLDWSELMDLLERSDTARFVYPGFEN